MHSLALVCAALATIVWLAACGTSGYNTGALAREIRSALDAHPDFTVGSVHCPQHAERAKGAVIRCSATLRYGQTISLRATQLDDRGRSIWSPTRCSPTTWSAAFGPPCPEASSARADCPNHGPVVIGNAFTCELRDAGRYTRAR